MNRTGLLIAGLDQSESWTAGGWCRTIYMEGMHASSGYSSGDPRLTWYYFGGSSHDSLDGWNGTPSSNKRWTVVHVDMDMEGVKEEEYSGPDAGKTEETVPGGFVAYNDDDDNGNGTADRLESGPVSNENDLVKITIKRPLPYTLTGYVCFNVTEGAGKVRIWTSPTKGGTPVTLPAIYPLSDPDFPKELYVEGYETSSSPRDVTLSAYYTVAGKTFYDHIKLTVVDVDLDIWNEHNGPKLDYADKVSPGSFVLVNIDDDDGADGDDNSNNVIDGDNDKLDMAMMRLGVQPYSATGLTIQLKGSDASKVRVFNESGTAVTLTETIAPSRFGSGALDYYVEGISEGSCEFTLEVKNGSTLIYNPTPKVKVTVKEYYSPFNRWGGWPGGQADTSLNPTETINSSDLGLSGNIKWAVDHGGTSGTIVSHTPSSGTEWSHVVVRYDTQSANNSFTQAVEIKAYDTGANSKLAAVRRTVFACDWSPPSTTNGMYDAADGKDLLEFPAGTGTDRGKAEFNWDGERGAWRTAAKVEAVLNFSPSGIDWTARGVGFAFGSLGNTKFGFHLHRKRIATVVNQMFGEGARIIGANDADWVYDGEPDWADAQYPSAATPNKAFRMDAPGFDADMQLQEGFRVDLREVAEWHNGSGWSMITSTTNAYWHVNITSVLPDSRKGGLNDDGAGATAADVPNTQSVANAGPDQNAASSAVVTLNGTGSSDADNDTLTYKWTQTGGPTVTLSSDTNVSPTFTSPVGPAVLTFELKVGDICKNLYHHKPSSFESTGDSVTINVAAL